MDKENFDFPHLVMNGHGGQRLIINFKTGEILSMQAIRNNFNQTEIEELLFDSILFIMVQVVDVKFMCSRNIKDLGW